jgi:hypothetical protein
MDNNLMTDDAPFEMAKLKPAAEWEYDRWKVDFYTVEGGTIVTTKYLIAMVDEVNNIIGVTTFPRGSEWAEWNCVEENVRVPRETGPYGHLIHASKWEDNTPIRWEHMDCAC